MSEYTDQDRINEDCCWTWQRDQCKGPGCRCTCHTSGEPARITYFGLVKEIAAATARAETAAAQLAAVTAVLAVARAERDRLDALTDALVDRELAEQAAKLAAWIERDSLREHLVEFHGCKSWHLASPVAVTEGEASDGR